MIEGQKQFYTIRGKWRIAQNKFLDYLVKGLVPRETIEPIVPYFPTTKVEQGPMLQSALEGGVPRPLGAHLVEVMTKFENESQAIYRHNASRLDHVYETLADSEEMLAMPLEDIAANILGVEKADLTKPALLAVHKAIKRRPFYIAIYTDALITGLYVIRPKKQSSSVDTVARWVREYLEHTANIMASKPSINIKAHPLHDFVRKAQRLIHLSRKTRSPTTMFNIGPTAQKFDTDTTNDGSVYKKTPIETFSATDRMILDYLHCWVVQRSLMSDGILRSAGSHILRFTGLYHDIPLTPATGTLFLQELGLFSPWEDINLLDEYLGLPGHGIAPHADRMLEESTQLADQLADKSGENGLEDKMQHLRKDWGDLPVFCVDDVHAEEIDDGFSLERIPSEDDKFWIHIHVANPSAFIQPDHLFAKYAAYLNQTVYSPERVYRMLPSSITKSRFSLGADRPTLTFSAKVDTAGEILDSNVTNGYIRNVMYITPTRLRKLFGVDHDETPSLTLNVGGQMPERTREEMQENISEEHQASLHILRELAGARLSRRLQKGAMENSSSDRASALVSFGNQGFEPYKLGTLQGYHYLGDPKIQISGLLLDPFEPVENTKQDLVSHMMLLGGEIAGQWCKDHGIPVVFSATASNPEYPPQPTNQGGKNASNQPGPRAYSAAIPASHTTLGMDQYVKCTSPLRRYSDLQGHWQIEAALRQEAEHGDTQLEAMRDMSVLPFSQGDIETMISQSAWRNMVLKKAQNRSNHFWMCQLLFRAFYFNETPLPETFQCLIRAKLEKRYLPTDLSGIQYGGTLYPFGLQCVVLCDEGIEVEVGDLVETKLTLVELYYQSIVFKATGVIKKPGDGAAIPNPTATL